MTDRRLALRPSPRNLLWVGCIGSVLLSVSAPACSSGAPHSAPRRTGVATVSATLRIVHEAQASQWSSYETQADGRAVPVFVMHDLQPKPVVFLLQGSGCSPAFSVEAG